MSYKLLKHSGSFDKQQGPFPWVLEITAFNHLSTDMKSKGHKF